MAGSIRNARARGRRTTAPWCGSSAICLRQLGFSDIDDAADGAAALEKMNKQALWARDLGLEHGADDRLTDLLRNVRANPALETIPFIMVDGGIQDRERDRGQEGRRQQYIVKPFNAQT